MTITIDKDFLEKQKKLLEARKAQLMRELKMDGVKNLHGDNEFDAIFPDFGEKEDENAAEVAAYEGNLSMEKNLEVSLFNVNKALKKIDEGKYGVCEKCGNMIEPERLRAFPSATACMDCKKKFS
ncbi:MAG: TraR/DksA C4-type zinc finger protein [Candidatus Komeilibacteria bacterium]|nr:TraR/DksA C4-type zinc finger protein [Candidatus Komeilibacteria bacterium]